MGKVVILVPVFLAPSQIDDFGKEIERSVKGSLYLNPGSLVTLSLAEWEHVQKKHPKIAENLRVLSVERVESGKKKPVKIPEPVKEVLPVVPVEPIPEPVPVRHEERSVGKLKKRRVDG